MLEENQSSKIYKLSLMLLKYLPYVNLLYFLEIFYIMLLFFFVYGKIISIIIGLVLNIFLVYMIVSIYFRNKNFRFLQLIWIDLHIGFSIPFFIYKLISYQQSETLLSTLFILLRIVLFIFEITYFYLLTGIFKKDLYWVK